MGGQCNGVNVCGLTNSCDWRDADDVRSDDDGAWSGDDGAWLGDDELWNGELAAFHRKRVVIWHTLQVSNSEHQILHVVGAPFGQDVHRDMHISGSIECKRSLAYLLAR